MSEPVPEEIEDYETLSVEDKRLANLGDLDTAKAHMLEAQRAREDTEDRAANHR